MTFRVSVGWVARFLLVAFILSGCRGCGRTAPLAEIVQLAGNVSRDYAVRPGAFSPAEAGATFAIGDGLRTDPSAQARLRLRGGGTLDVREDTLIRFLAGTPSAQRRVSLETGTAEIEMGAEGLEFETRFGMARIEPGARIRLSADGKQTRFEVLVGAAVVETEGSPTEALRAGQSLDVGSHLTEDAGPPSKPDAGAPPDSTAEDPTSIVAELDSAGIRRAAPRSTSFVPLAPGTTRLDPGSRLIVPAGAKIVVRRGAERATVSGAADIVVGTASGALIETHSGRVAVDTSPTLIRIDVPGGTITLRGTSFVPASADVILDGRETDVLSRAGTTELRGRKSSTTLNGREAAWFDDSGAVQKSIVTNEAPLFTMPAGETATIHSLRVPAPVLIRVNAACGSGAYLEVSRGGRFLPVGLLDATEEGALAQHTVVLSLGEGSHPYRVRCPEPSTAALGGSLRILRDSGGAPLLRTPGHNVLHADGRRYSVLYQNLLPELTLDWPDASPGEALTLKVREGNDRAFEIALGTPSYSFPSGKLGDGTYTFWFEVQRDPRLRSLDTIVRIAFDNAAPTAEIREPQDGFSPIDGKVSVSGVAVEGVSVSVGGTPIPLDAQLRFHGDVAISPGDRSIAIRIEHPTRGIQYYLRRIGGT